MTCSKSIFFICTDMNFYASFQVFTWYVVMCWAWLYTWAYVRVKIYWHKHEHAKLFIKSMFINCTCNFMLLIAFIIFWFICELCYILSFIKVCIEGHLLKLCGGHLLRLCESQKEILMNLFYNEFKKLWHIIHLHYI